jgi:hypothetical protein
MRATEVAAIANPRVLLREWVIYVSFVSGIRPQERWV